ncbi:MAG: Uroporphyrinogen III decarboxylase, partial [uncultured Nocardioidaceae bacterium]
DDRACPDRRAPAQGGARGAGAAHPGLVHAPGRAVAPGVPEGPRGRGDARVLHAPRAHHRDHAAARAPVRRRRGHLLLRHRAAAQGGGRGPRHQARRRPGRGLTGGDAGRRRGDPRPDPRARPLHHRGGPTAGGRARRHPADRVRRRAVHGGVVPRRGRPVEGARAHQGDDVRRAGGVGRAAAQDRRHRRGVPGGAGRRGCLGGPALRLLGGGDRPARLPRARHAALRAGVVGGRAAGSAEDPLRRRDRGAARPHGTGRRRRRRRRLEGAAGRGGTPCRRPRRPGQPRPDAGVRADRGDARPGGGGAGGRAYGAGSHLQPRARGAALDRPRPAGPADRLRPRALGGL